MSKRHRGKTVALPEWWLARVRDICQQRQDAFGETMADLGRKLAVAARRQSRWDHGAVSRFLSGTITTYEMANAFAVVLSLHPAVYIAETENEAEMLHAVARRFLTPTQRARLAAVADELADMERQTKPLQSAHGQDEGGRGRAGRTGRRG